MSLLRLRMEAKGTAIMREVVLPEDFTLAFLHAAIQSVFGWLDCHLHEFTDSKGMRYGDRDGEPPDDGGPYSFDDDFPMKKFFRKPGDRLEYEYDFGDMNEVSISLVGRTTAARRAHFLSQGPDMVEDSASLGGTEGVVEKLKHGKQSERRQIAIWLSDAFRKSTEQVIHEPSAGEIFLRIYRMVWLADVAEVNQKRFYWHDLYQDCMNIPWLSRDVSMV